jgi:DNA-binding IclR family transcriptional regulator
VLSGAEISERLGVARSTGYRYLQSLVGSGFIEECRGGFQLGPRLFELARLARRGIGLSEIARPVMRELAAQAGESVLLTRRSGAAVVCLEMEEATHPIRLSYERGHILPINAGPPHRSSWRGRQMQRWTPCSEAARFGGSPPKR